jgi:glyoxylase-like metal-dependent hydrolase (beta-lactamase superfamily II)
MAAILAAAGGPIHWVLVTHTHRDHSPMAAELARRSGAQLIGLNPPEDGRQDETFVPHHRPSDGERLSLGDVEVLAIHTPGHASNCVCYFVERERLLITGDHVLEGVSPVILPPDGNMSDYLNSLDKLLTFDFEYIAPGHGDLMDRGKGVVQALRAHRLAREAKVLRSIPKLSEATLDTLTPMVYDDVPPDRHTWARLTLEAHLIKLVREGRVQERRGRFAVLSA